MIEPLIIERLALRGFRNLAPLDIEPGSRFNIIHGENGAGKSNLLEAIHLLGRLGSFRGAKTDDLLMDGEERAVLKMRIAGALASSVIAMELSRGKARKVALDGKRPRRLDLVRERAPMVIFHPAHLALASGSAELRRDYMNELLLRISPGYQEALESYEKALRSRNRLLRDEELRRDALTPYERLMARYGAILIRERARLAEEISGKIEGVFAEVIGESVRLDVRYEPRVEGGEEELLRAYQEAFVKDRARGFTADGPQADELALRLSDRSARSHGSQGQHRSIALAMKMVELDLLGEELGKIPILLLDDVSSELDRKRNRRLFEKLSRLGGQVFLTTTHPEFILLEEHRREFEIEAGRIVGA